MITHAAAVEHFNWAVGQCLFPLDYHELHQALLSTARDVEPVCRTCSGSRVLLSGPRSGSRWCFVKREVRADSWWCDSWKPAAGAALPRVTGQLHVTNRSLLSK